MKLAQFSNQFLDKAIKVGNTGISKFFHWDKHQTNYYCG